MKSLEYVLTLSVFLLFSVVVDNRASAQTTLPYYNSFEDATENAQWTLCNGPQCSTIVNKWVISSTESYHGTHAMVISDNGNDARYSNKKNSTVAFREFELPTGVDYTLSFNWRCQGQEGKDGFYVCWLPASSPINSSVGGLPPLVSNNAIKWGTDKRTMLCNQYQWQAARTVVKIPKSSNATTVYRLYFVWDNDTQGNSAPSACIDNISLVAGDDATAPTNFVHTQNDADVTLSWLSKAPEFEVMYYTESATGSATIDTIKQRITQTNYTISDVTEAWYDFYVRAIYGPGDTSAWTSLANQLIFVGSNRCINYIDLKSSKVVCTAGTFNYPYSKPGPVDFGPEDWSRSRHTMHFRPGETDPYTGGKLRTVPDGELVSIRLGNSDGGAQAESITYDYKIGQNEKVILMVNYAIVYEAPVHNQSEQPSFLLEILDENGTLINDDGLFCNQAYFYPPSADGGDAGGEWDTFDGASLGKEGILWQDWQSMGINLIPFAGKTIKIRFTVKDCSQTQHFAHAFFTISCTKAEISGYTCGESTEFAVEAPEGFDYRWYKDGTPKDQNDVPLEIKSTERRFSVKESECGLYYCDVMFKGKNKCYFTLPAYLMPRLPKSSFTPQWTPRDCQNIVTLQNTGGITADGKIVPDVHCDQVEWTMRNIKGLKDDTRTDSVFNEFGSPVFEFDSAGGSFEVKVYSSISNNECFDETEWMTVNVPPIGRYEKFIVDTICKGERYRFNGQNLREAGKYKEEHRTRAGCDSIIHLDLTVVDKIETSVDTSLCYGRDTLFIKGQPFTTTGVYTATYTSVRKCDSVVTYNAKFRDINFEVSDIPDDICLGDNGFKVGYNVDAVDATLDEVLSYKLEFLDAAKEYFNDLSSAPIDGDSIVFDFVALQKNDSLAPGIYKVRVWLEEKDVVNGCGPFADEIEFTVRYPSTVIAQKWNDVLALYDVNKGPDGVVVANPGWEYTSYQWYRNNQPIAGATGSYIYIGESGEEFTQGDEFTVMLSRRDNSAQIMSCPIYPEKRDIEREFVSLTMAKSGTSFRVLEIPASDMCEAQWFNAAGQMIGRDVVYQGQEMLLAPQQSGIYLLRLISAKESMTIKVVVTD